MPPQATDTTRPNVARVYDCLLGGIEAFKADRDQAAGLLRICPSLGMVALENRYFLARAVTWAVGQDVTQFVDLGAGAPIQRVRAGVLEDIHVTARAASAAVRVAYVDHDPVVLARSKVFRAPAYGVTVAAADLTDPGSVLADQSLRAVIDPAEPICVIFGLVLGLLPARKVREIIAGYIARLAPGSLVVISCGRCDDEMLWRQLSEAYTAAPAWNHTPAEVKGFLGGLELVPPGLAGAQNWRAGWPDVPAAPPGPVYALCAVARKAEEMQQVHPDTKHSHRRFTSAVRVHLGRNPRTDKADRFGKGQDLH
ncbi:MAG: SAM-dependent methyltransferase [Actinobacteria bacterium]|nr:SAM-dependent methyltransferase [Actinomycetota bacterium]